MLFNKFNFEDPAAVERFRLESLVHSATWEHYYESYCACLYKIIEKGLTRYYPFNCRAHAILFLIRHSIELCLKFNLHRNGKEVPITHDFEELYKAFGDESLVPHTFKEVAQLVSLGPDGSAFRYYYDYSRDRPFFSYNDQLKVASFLKKYAALTSNEDFVIRPMAPVFGFSARKPMWDLTLHMGECHGLGHIRTQYDMTIEYIIEGVLVDGWEIQKLYLPLLFLLRHSLELALKFNIGEVQKYSTLIKDKTLNQEHSLVTLYNVYKDFLSKIDRSKMDGSVARGLSDYEKVYGQFNTQLHNLDITSRYFRFPVDKSGVPHKINLRKNGLIQILKVYYQVDPFITFTNDVLEEQGILFRYDPEY